MSRLRDVEKPNAYKDLLRKVAQLQVRHPWWTLGMLLVLTLALVGGIAQVRTVASLEQMMPSDVPSIQAFNELRDAGMGQDIIAVVISLDETTTLANPTLSTLDYATYVYVHTLEQELAALTDVHQTQTFAQVLEGGSGSLLSEAQYAQALRQPATKAQLARFVNTDQTSTIILLMSDVSADDERMNALSQSVQDIVRSAGHPPGITVGLTGTPIIQQRLGEVIAHDRELTERISAVFVFLVVALVFGSFAAALVPMVAILLSIIWLYGVMGYTHLPISTLASGVAAMVIGIGVDYSIHLRNKYEYERRKGESVEYAVAETLANTGFVLTVVTIVTAVAFLAFLSGHMPEMGRFGLLMTIGVVLAFFLSVIGLPALFIVEERIRAKLPKSAQAIAIRAGRQG